METNQNTSKYWAHQRRNEDGSVSPWTGTCYAQPVDHETAWADAERQARGATVVGLKVMTQDEFWGRS